MSWHVFRAWSVVVLLAMATQAGCASFSSFKVPQTLPLGDQQILLGAALDLNSIEETGRKPLPDITLGSRFGFGERTDVGARFSFLPLGREVTTMTLEVSGKYQLLPQKWLRGVQVAVQPSVGHRCLAAGGTDAHIYDASLPLIAGYWVSPRHQVIVSPQISAQVLQSHGASPILVPAAGASLGWLWQRIPSQAFMIESTTMFTQRGVEGSLGTVLFHVGVAILWTRR